MYLNITIQYEKKGMNVYQTSCFFCQTYNEELLPHLPSQIMSFQAIVLSIRFSTYFCVCEVML